MPRGDVMPQPIEVDWRCIETASCTRKRVFASRDAAATFNTDPRQFPYRCAFDHTHWHLGHQLKMKSLRKLAFALRARANDRTPQ